MFSGTKKNCSTQPNLFAHRPGWRPEGLLLFPAAVIITGKDSPLSTEARALTDVYIVGPLKVGKGDLMGLLASPLGIPQPRRFPTIGVDFMMTGIEEREDGEFVPSYYSATPRAFNFWPTIGESIETYPSYSTRVSAFQKRLFQNPGIMLLVSNELAQLQAMVRIAQELNDNTCRCYTVDFVEESNREIRLNLIKDSREISTVSQNFAHERQIPRLQRLCWQLLSAAHIINQELIQLRVEQQESKKGTSITLT